MAAAWSLIEEKRALRRAMRQRREALPPEERDRATAAVVASLAGLPEFVAARVISAYLPTRGELDPGVAIAAAAARGATIVYPRVTTDRPRLRFHRISAAAPPRVGAFGILEPPPESPEIPLEAIDFMLTPGLAFDPSGRRLGHGSGYYDEVAGLLRAAGRGFLAGLGFAFQLLPHCPSGEGDVPIDCVVTEAGVIRCDNGRK